MNELIVSQLSKLIIHEVSDKVSSCSEIIIAGVVLSAFAMFLGYVQRVVGLIFNVMVLGLSAVMVYSDADLVFLAIKEIGIEYAVSIAVFYSLLSMSMGVMIAMIFWRGATNRNSHSTSPADGQ